MSSGPPGDRDPVVQKSAAPPAPATDPPPERVRGQRWLEAMDRQLARFDGWCERWLPASANPLTQTGRAANLALIVAVVSGVLMLFWYQPSVQFAYSSLDDIRGRTLGGWVRAIHRYSSDFTMLLLAIHALRVFVARKFTGSRWLPWVSGVVLLALVWFIGWTGFWLVWDQPAQQVALGSMRFLDALPVFGEPLSRQFVSDRLVPSLLFFVVFFLHMLLPLAVAGGLVVHLSRLNRVRLLPDRRLTFALIAGLALAALIVPAPLDDPARMAEKPSHFTVDAWYLTPLALSLRFREGGLWLALGATAALAAVPWVLGRRVKRIATERDVDAVTPWQTVVLETRCHACTQCVQDCPFDAVSMVSRRDGKRLDSRAWVNPSRCVGCGVCVGSCDSDAMSLTWFDVHREEERILAELNRPGAARRLALVAGDIDGDRRRFAEKRWREDLEGYTLAWVPTASWVRPKFVERVLREGAESVLIVRDARAEAAARDGNRWIAERLAGERKPVFRPKRAGDGADRRMVVDYDPSDRAGLRAAARRFRDGDAESAAATHRRPSKPTAIAAGLLLAVVLAAATLAPSHLRVANPAPSNPELVISFKAFGVFGETAALDPEEEAKKPVHMRGRSTEKPRRQPVTLRVTVDDESHVRTFTAKGVSQDGPAIDEWRLDLAPGSREVRIDLDRGEGAEPRQWSGIIDARPRRLHVITYTPNDGFRLE